MLILKLLRTLFKDTYDIKVLGNEIMASIKGEDSLYVKEIERKPRNPWK